MIHSTNSKLDPRKRYLQIALNSTLEDAREVIATLPVNDRIIVEAGTPLIKRYGEEGIRQVWKWYGQHIEGQALMPASVSKPDYPTLSSFIFKILREKMQAQSKREEIQQNKDEEIISISSPYIVADLKMMDRGETEVEIAWRAGASAAIALGTAPIESLDAFIEHCEQLGLDAMVDMMNVEFPLAVLRKLKKLPHVIILHRGVDEERFNKEKQIPLHEIRRIKGNYNMLISIAGGDTIREVQRAIFNDADIVVVWKSFYQASADTGRLAEEFLKEIK